MESLTECRPVPGPLVFGYLRLSASSRARRVALTCALATYCGPHELLLGGVFTDDSHSRAVLSPGFAGLLDALALKDCYAVVVPSAAHLGAGVTGRTRVHRITETGRRLILVRSALAPAALR
jgi:hypothetical protein